MEFALKRLPVGTRLFRGVPGTAGSLDAPPPPFFGAGGMRQRKRAAGSALVEHYTTALPVAAAYVTACLPGRREPTGWVLEYAVRVPPVVADVSADQLHYETEEVEAEFGQHGLAGYWLRWAGPRPDVEVALIDPADYLEPVAAFPCVGGAISPAAFVPARPRPRPRKPAASRANRAARAIVERAERRLRSRPYTRPPGRA